MVVKQVVNRFLNSNTWFLYDESTCNAWLVDCGDLDLIFSTLKQPFIIKGVFLTHAHFDHIYGLNDLLKMCPEVLVYTNQAGEEALLSDRLNLSRYHGEFFIFKYPQNIRRLLDEQTVLLGKGERLKIFMTPGHSPSCISYQCGDYLFTGDSFIPYECPVITLPNANKSQFQNSLLKIKSMSTPSSVICAGHGSRYLAVEVFN